LAEYRDLYDEIQKEGAGLTALSIDPPDRSEAVRRQLDLPYMILCDTQRVVVREWGVFNQEEKGGIAKPAVFVVAPDHRVKFQSVDQTATRVPARAVLDFLRTGMSSHPAEPVRKSSFPSVSNFWRATLNSVRYGVRSTGK
jgi:peroxiredoxin